MVERIRLCNHNMYFVAGVVRDALTLIVPWRSRWLGIHESDDNIDIGNTNESVVLLLAGI